MLRRAARLPILVAATIAIFALGDTAASAAPSSLDGLRIEGVDGSLAVGGNGLPCPVPPAFDGTRVQILDARGDASGAHAGPFTATVDGTFANGVIDGRQVDGVLAAFTGQAAVTSAQGHVGIELRFISSADTVGLCGTGPDTDFYNMSGPVAYTATITTADGVYRDEGTARLTAIAAFVRLHNPERETTRVRLLLEFRSALGVPVLVGPDRDADGHPDPVDNCPDVHNAAQGNLDGDRQGDACDADVDGDGLDGLAETLRGTDPRRSDTDLDGWQDGADQCPVVPGPRSGCPRRADDPAPGGPREQAPSRSPGTQGDARATVDGLRLSALARRAGRRTVRVRVAGRLVPPRGMARDEACSPGGRLRITVSAGGRRIAAAVTRLRADCSFARVVVARTRRRSVTVGVRFLGNRVLAAQAEALVVDRRVRRRP